VIGELRGEVGGVWLISRFESHFWSRAVKLFHYLIAIRLIWRSLTIVEIQHHPV
jgi:hypothetical protein